MRSRSTEQRLSDGDVNRCLRDVLREYNEQQRAAINHHLDVLRDNLELTDDAVIRFAFGGSQSKHTAVRGLSDYDALAVINDSSFSGQSPAEVIRRMAERVQQRLPQTSVSRGDLAVTVKYSDGIEVQILPAIRTKSGVRIADPGSKRWSTVIHPDRFARKLTEVNQKNGGRVIPTVKLMKGLAEQVILVERNKISAYHMESLAIEAFRNYQGAKDLKTMVRHFAVASIKHVRQPIVDTTGQSRYVDEYMGQANSLQRQEASKSFQRMLNKFDSCRTDTGLKNMFWS